MPARYGQKSRIFKNIHCIYFYVWMLQLLYLQNLNKHCSRSITAFYNSENISALSKGFINYLGASNVDISKYM